MANYSDAFSALGINFKSNAVHVSSTAIPELDIAYGVTDHFSVEFVLTVPQKHTVTLLGAGKLGTFKHLPPTLVAQYRFDPIGIVQPCVGAGLNFILISSVNLKVANVPLDLDHSSFCLAAQIGAEVKRSDTIYLNFNLKKVAIRSDVSAGGAKLTEAQLDPLLISVGLGYRF